MKRIGIIVIGILTALLAFSLLKKKNNVATTSSNSSSGSAATASSNSSSGSVKKTTTNSNTTNPLNSSGVDTRYVVGTFLINNSNQKVYQQKTGVQLYSYPNAIGFLEDGTMVFREIITRGELSEIINYYT